MNSGGRVFGGSAAFGFRVWGLGFQSFRLRAPRAPRFLSPFFLGKTLNPKSIKPLFKALVKPY